MTTQAGSSQQAQHGAEGSEAGAATETRQEQAQRIVRRNVYWALGAGLVPFPIIDFLGLTAVQIKMLKQLSELYGVDFFEDKARTIIGSLITGVGSLALTGAIASSLFKLMPIVGQIAGFIGQPLFAGTLTMAIGRLFVMHYESGGTLLTFDPSKMRDHFRHEVEQAKGSVQQLRTKDPVEPRAP